MRLTDEQLELLPTDEEVAFYREHGWYVTRKLLSDEEIEDALYGAELHWAGERDHVLPITGFLDWRPGDGDGLRLNDYVSLQSDFLRPLALHPLIGAVAARLAGTPAIRTFHDQLIYKPPARDDEAPAVGWHTDQAYWHTCTSDDMLTAWIPFHDCTEEMGTITMIDGSHRWPENDLRTFFDTDFAALEDRFETGGATVERVPMRLERGQMSFHHGHTIHGSPPNRSDSPRMSLAVHFQDAGNRYQVALDENGRKRLHINDLLCRKDPEGHPDYADPDICPVVWSEGER